MIDHLELFVQDPGKSAAFFSGALGPLGYALHVEGKSLGFGAAMDKLDFWVRSGGPSAPSPHVAFNCATRALVARCHEAALRAGGIENRAPCLLPQIHAHYYAGFVFDPDGHNIEFVCHAAEA